MNTPNKITLSRILLLPLIVFFYLADFIPYGRLVATVLFAVAALTDMWDGKYARKHNMVTDLGKFFDAIADKCLIMTGLILILAGVITGNTPIVYPTWAGIICIIIILAREFIVSALRQIAAAKGKVLAAGQGGKIKATIQDIVVTLYMALAFFVTEFSQKINADVFNKITGTISFILLIALCITTLLTVYTGLDYIVKNRFVFMEESKNFKKKEVEAKPVKENEVEITKEEKGE